MDDATDLDRRAAAPADGARLDDDLAAGVAADDTGQTHDDGTARASGGIVDFSGAPDELNALRTQLADATDDLTELRAQHAALQRERAIERLDAEWEAALPAYMVSQLFSMTDGEGPARQYLPTRRGSLVRGALGAGVMLLIIRYGPEWMRWIPALLILGFVWWTVDAVRKADAYAAAESAYRRRRAELGG